MPASPQHPLNTTGCSVCSERGGGGHNHVGHKGATPKFPHKVPEPPYACHGCIERAAILAEVAGLREMVLALSNGMLELNTTVADQKRHIATLEAKCSRANTAAAAAAGGSRSHPNSPSGEYSSTAAYGASTRTGVSPSRGGGGGGGESNVGNSSVAISSLIEKMLENSVHALESRIGTSVRAAESQRSTLELKALRDEFNRRTEDMERNHDARLLQMETKWSASDRQIKETVASLDRRATRTIFQLCQTLGVAVPPALQSNNNNISTHSSNPLHQSMISDTSDRAAMMDS